jgi:hypothetical protein
MRSLPAGSQHYAFAGDQTSVGQCDTVIVDCTDTGADSELGSQGLGAPDEEPGRFGGVEDGIPWDPKSSRESHLEVRLHFGKGSGVHGSNLNMCLGIRIALVFDLFHIFLGQRDPERSPTDVLDLWGKVRSEFRPELARKPSEFELSGTVIVHPDMTHCAATRVARNIDGFEYEDRFSTTGELHRAGAANDSGSYYDDVEAMVTHRVDPSPSA